VEQAHASNSTLEIRWGKQIFQTDKIEKFLAKPYPDLALVRMDPFEHPCVYFDGDVETNDQFYSWGFTDLQPNGDSSLFVYEGPAGDVQLLLKLKETQVRPGLSGAPLLSHRTGGVCGLVKQTRDKNTDLGGRGVPATVILESIPELVALQQEVHAQDSSWLRLLNPIDPDWLKELSEHLEQEFLERMRGGDALTRQQATSHYVELLVRERVKPGPDKPAPVTLPLASLFEQANRPAGDKADDGPLKLLIFSEGGGGKTTSLLKLAVDAVRKVMIDPLAPIPVFIPLNTFDTQERGSDELWDMICRAAYLEKDKMQSQLKSGRPFLFMMDGFNEIGPKFQEACVLALQELMNQGTHSYIITSRPGGLAENLSAQVSGIKELEMVQLDENQIEDFLVRHGATGLYEQMGEQVKGLARNPFMLWALAQSCIGLPDGKMPRNIGQLYQTFIDQYVFEKREIGKVPRPTEYNYLLVKRQILSSFALEMTREAVTRREESLDLLKSIAAQLKQIRSENEGVMEIKPYKLMPDPPAAKALVDESVNNGVLRRVGNSLEFMHQSVQDYFSAIAISTLEPPSAIVPAILDLTPPLSTQLSYSRRFKTSINHISYVGGRLFGTTIMLSGLLPDSSELVKALRTRDQLLAAHCLGSTVNVESALEDELRAEYLTLLDRWHERHRWVGCRCLAAAQLKDEKILTRLKEVAEKDPEYDVRWAAIEALRQLSGEDAVREFEEVQLRWPVDELDKVGDMTSGAMKALGDVLESLPPDKQIEWLNDFIEQAVTPEHPGRESSTLIVRSFYSESIAVQLIDTLQGTNGDNHARANAAAGLGIMEVESALEPLMEALKDDATEVRLAAARALTLIKDETAIPSLRETLIELTTAGEDLRIRESAAPILDDVPGGWSALYAPINEALNKSEWATALGLIGEDEPFLPRLPQLYLLRNFAYQGLERWEEALADCDWILRNAPPGTASGYAFPTMHTRLLGRLNRLEDALFFARKTAEAFPNEAETHTVLAWQCYKSGQHNEGITAAQNALNLDPNQPKAAFNLGLLLTASERPDEAAGAYQQALALCGNLDAETARAYLNGVIGNLDALAASRPELASAINEQKEPLVKAAREL
jgi:HEAT repeat protein